MAQQELTGFAEALRSARKAAGMSQEHLAEVLGVRQSSVSNWELGTKEPSRANVRSVEVTLGLEEGSLSSLLGWVPPGQAPRAKPAPAAVPATTRAIMADKTLDRKSRSLLLALYRTLSSGGPDQGKLRSGCTWELAGQAA